MNDKVIVITREGKAISLAEWQRIYDLPVGSSRIGEFFYLTEPRFEKDIALYGRLIVNELLIRLLDAIRKASNHPLTINAFNRDSKKQQELKALGFRAATHSPHLVSEIDGMITGACAADIDTLSKDDTKKLVKRIQEVSSIVKIKCRIGFKQYMDDGDTFVHVDVCPEYYAYGKPWHHLEHPEVWELTNTW